MSRYFIPFILLMLSLSACEHVIDVDIKPNTTQLVIEGNITNIAGQQTITLTKTANYGDVNVFPPVSGATVVVTNPSGTFNFAETTTGQYINNSIRGRQGQQQSIRVTSGGKTYTASSLMPQQVSLDSLGVNLVYIGTRVIKTLSVYYHDPVDQVNQYRFIMYVNGIQVKQTFTADDAGTNGNPVHNLLYQTDITLKIGDKVDVDMLCIDGNVYNYWYSLSRQGSNSPNSPSTPSNPFSNISGGALGYFSAHTIQRKSIVLL